MRLVKILWKDAVSASGSSGRWSGLDEVKSLEPVDVKTVGWVVKETDTYITVISHHAGETETGGDICIPKAWIQKLVDLPHE